MEMVAMVQIGVKLEAVWAHTIQEILLGTPLRRGRETSYTENVVRDAEELRMLRVLLIALLLLTCHGTNERVLLQERVLSYNQIVESSEAARL